jgi:hypothetical protein
MTKKEIIKEVEKRNPYPVDVFTEPSDKEWGGVGELLTKNKISPERVFGRWGRQVWEHCVSLMDELWVDEHERKEDEKNSTDELNMLLKRSNDMLLTEQEKSMDLYSCLIGMVGVFDRKLPKGSVGEEQCQKAKRILKIYRDGDSD